MTPTEQEKKAYQQYVKEVTPKHNFFLQLLKAFLMGGMICTLGQVIINLLIQVVGLDRQDASSWCSILLVLLAALLTGLDLYPKLAKWGGAGTLVPITGFANSVCAPAMEYKKEGQVYGIGSKIFSLAGSVILYGVVFSFFLGVLYLIYKVLNGGL